MLAAACSLVQERSDDGAALGVGLEHQRVEVRQEGVADVQDVARRLREGGVPRDGILSLTDQKIKGLAIDN